jgi:hypothetical protein
LSRIIVMAAMTTTNSGDSFVKNDPSGPII